MIVTGAMFADAARIDDGGKLDLNGGVWDWYGVPLDPPILHTVPLVVLVEAEEDGVRSGQASIETFDPTGARVADLTAEVSIPPTARNGFQIVPCPVLFRLPGRYSFVISLGSEHAVALGLEIRSVPHPEHLD